MFVSQPLDVLLCAFWLLAASGLQLDFLFVSYTVPHAGIKPSVVVLLPKIIISTSEHPGLEELEQKNNACALATTIMLY